MAVANSRYKLLKKEASLHKKKQGIRIMQSIDREKKK